MTHTPSVVIPTTHTTSSVLTFQRTQTPTRLQGMTARSIKSAVERVCDQQGVQVDVAVTEALAVLQRVQLAVVVEGAGATARWVAVPPVRASEVLTQRWRVVLDEGAGARMVGSKEDGGNGVVVQRKTWENENQLTTWHD